MSALLQMSGPVVDLIYRVAALPMSGEEAEVEDFMLSPGGGYNAMVAARQAGMMGRCGGSVGTGPLAQIVRAGLEQHGIDTPRPADPAHDQGCCTVLIEPSGERSFVAAEGAEGYLTNADLAALPLAGCGWMLVSGYTLHYRGARDPLARWLGAAHAKGQRHLTSTVTTSRNGDDSKPALLRHLLRRPQQAHPAATVADFCIAVLKRLLRLDILRAHAVEIAKRAFRVLEQGAFLPQPSGQAGRI